MAKLSRSENHLPVDLLPIILSNLPVKSLLRFRCVSKSWLALVDDDADFARLHLDTFKSRNSDDDTLIFVVENFRSDATQLSCSLRSTDTFEPLLETPFFLETKYLWCHFVSSVDGLVLLSLFDFINGRSFVLWNPSLGQFRNVRPLPPITTTMPMAITVIGLGYDPLAKDYKLVILINNNVNLVALISVAIYTVGAGSWKTIPLPDWRWSSIITKNTVYLHGSLYFVAEAGKIRDLVSFDLSMEVFNSHDTSIKSSELVHEEGLVLIDGRFYVIMFDKDFPETFVWLLERETRNWTKCCTYYTSRNSQVLYLRKNGDLLTEKTYTYVDFEENLLFVNEVASYRPETHEYKILQQKRSNRLTSISYVSAYVESLVLHQRCLKDP